MRKLVPAFGDGPAHETASLPKTLPALVRQATNGAQRTSSSLLERVPALANALANVRQLLLAPRERSLCSSADFTPYALRSSADASPGALRSAANLLADALGSSADAAPGRLDSLANTP